MTKSSSPELITTMNCFQEEVWNYMTYQYLLHFTSPFWYGHEQILVYLHTGSRKHEVLLIDIPLLLILVWASLGDLLLYLGWDEVGGVRQDSQVVYDDCARDSVTVAIGGRQLLSLPSPRTGSFVADRQPSVC
jgi:hypothetical protein